MIAHRLSTIECADNLLYFESPSRLVSAQKNTQRYFEIMEKLKAISYAYGDDTESSEEDDGQLSDQN